MNNHLINREGVIREGLIHFGEDRQIHYVECGRGMPIVFLPDNGCSALDFGPIMKLLSDEYRVIGIDIPGRVPTIWPDGEFDFIADLPAVLDWVLSALKIGPHLFVGHGSGGVAGLYYANRHRGRVRGLVLFESFVQHDYQKRSVAKNGRKAIRMAEDEEDAFQARRRVNAKWLNEHPNFRESFSHSQHLSDVRPWIGQLNLPIELFIGDLGQLIPREDDLHAWRYQLGMIGVDKLKMEVISKAGHWMMLDAPEDVAARMKRFFETLDLKNIKTSNLETQH